MPEHGDKQLDAVIVGGGAIGLASAWEAARRGLAVRVLERSEPGAGASTVAAGMIAPIGEVSFGEDELLELSLRAAEGWPQFASELEGAAGVAPGYRRRGALHVALDRDEAEGLKRRFALMERLGLEAEWLRGSECRRLEPGLATSVTAGILARHEATVEPRAMVAALAAAARSAGVEILEGAEVTEAILDGERLVGVRTADGSEHRAPHTVLAAGAWSGQAAWLPEPARPPVRPVKGQVLTLHGQVAGEPVCERVVICERIYAAPRAGGELAVGATVEEMGFDTRITAGGVYELLREAYRALPDVAELELGEAIAGLRPGTPDNLPRIGPGELPGLVLATGHFRNGIILAPLTAEIVVAHLLGDPDAQRVGPGPGAHEGAPA